VPLEQHPPFAHTSRDSHWHRRRALPRGGQTEWTALYHGMGLSATALVGMAPALGEVVEHLRAEHSPGVAPWAHLVLWVGVIQLSYAIYLIQLADWSSAWMTAHASLLVSAFYAMGLGVGLFSGRQASGAIVALGLTDRHHTGQLTGWCLIMLSLTLLVTYFLGRLSLRWHRR
jgi:hypothetical protein